MQTVLRAFGVVLKGLRAQSSHKYDTAARGWCREDSARVPAKHHDREQTHRLSVAPAQQQPAAEPFEKDLQIHGMLDSNTPPSYENIAALLPPVSQHDTIRKL